MDIRATNTTITNQNTDNTKSSTNCSSSTNFKDELKELESANKQQNIEKQQVTNNDKESNKLNHSDDNKKDTIKEITITTDSNNMINNEVNVQENILPQMNSSMNFSSNEQTFSSFMNNKNQQLQSSTKDLEEEARILSSMAENIAIVNKNKLLNQNEIKIINDKGIKTIDSTKSELKDYIVNFDSIILNEKDVEVFANIINNKELNLNTLTAENIEKSVKISKTLADLLLKSKDNNQPLRIDFDNNISVIIKISKDGKISADFLPSSQVAEAYLRENLPLLRQKFDNNNIEYNSLNQRERKENSKENNKKKGNSNE